jgi:pantoate kinase
MFLVGPKNFQLCGKGGQSHILRGSKGVGVTIESYGKVEISYINGCSNFGIKVY